MYVVGLNSYGGPEVLKLMEVPTPHPRSGEVRVKVRAAGINPVDVMVRDGSLAGWFGEAVRPFVPGMDISGTVDMIGDDVEPADGIAVGRAVVGVVSNFGGYGAYSQYVCLPAKSVIPLPEGVSFIEAASFLMNALTARNALDTLNLVSGSTILVTGAAGAVGGYAVALANHEGLNVSAIASPDDREFVESTGAVEFFERGQNVVDQIRLKHPSGVNAVIDAAGLGTVIAPTVEDNGTIIALRQGGPEDCGRGIKSVFVNVRDRVTDHDAIIRLGEQVTSGLLSLRVASTYSAQDAEAAHRRFAESGIRGRIVLDFESLMRADSISIF